MFIDYSKESKGYKLLNIRTKNVFIEISVRFEEPLQDVQLVEEETAEISSHSVDDSDDESGSVSYDILDLMFDISEHDISGSDSNPNVPTHLPNGSKRLSLLSGKMLEILLIQGELRKIFKERVFLFIAMILCCFRSDA